MKFNKETLDIAKLQVTQLKNDDIDFYDKLSDHEYEIFKNYIDKPKRILELGCGLGRMSIYLSKQLDYNAEFILADYDNISEKIKYGWNPGKSLYNKLDLTTKFCLMNNLVNFETFDLSKHDISKLKDIDLVISVMSVGFHYPIEQYMKKLLKICNGDMIFGIRKRKSIYNKESFSKYFETIIIKEVDFKIKESIMILKDIKNMENLKCL